MYLSLHTPQCDCSALSEEFSTQRECVALKCLMFGAQGESVTPAAGDAEKAETPSEARKAMKMPRCESRQEGCTRATRGTESGVPALRGTVAGAQTCQGLCFPAPGDLPMQRRQVRVSISRPSPPVCPRDPCDPARSTSPSSFAPPSQFDSA